MVGGALAAIARHRTRGHPAIAKDGRLLDREGLLFRSARARLPRHELLSSGRAQHLRAREQTSRQIRLCPEGRSGSGADLQFNQDSVVYQVAISDPKGVYGGATISSLTGTTDGDLDVVLDKLPQGSNASGAAGARPRLRRAKAVLSDPIWTGGEKQAVLSVMNALGSLRGATSPPLLALCRIMR